MAVQNTLAKSNGNQKLGITAFLNSAKVLENVEQALGKQDKQRFITGVISAVTTNPQLQECTNKSILAGSLLGESLKLSPSPQLGHYYLVPFNDKNQGKVAQFQLGYKGYIQLAIRSGQYKKLNVIAVKEGELEYFDPLNEDIKINMMVDKWDEREAKETIGYYAFFELINGFRKAMYWSKAQMESHAIKYSAGYKAKKGYTFWEKNFDGMAFKTLLRQLISKWGIMSVEMQQAFENDMTFTDDSGKVQYGDIDDNIIDAEVIVEQPQEEKTEDSVNGTDAASALFGN